MGEWTTRSTVSYKKPFAPIDPTERSAAVQRLRRSSGVWTVVTAALMVVTLAVGLSPIAAPAFALALGNLLTWAWARGRADSDRPFPEPDSPATTRRRRAWRRTLLVLQIVLPAAVGVILLGWALSVIFGDPGSLGSFGLTEQLATAAVALAVASVAASVAYPFAAAREALGTAPADTN